MCAPMPLFVTTTLHDLEYLSCKVSDVVEYEMGINPRSGRGHQVL